MDRRSYIALTSPATDEKPLVYPETSRPVVLVRFEGLVRSDEIDAVNAGSVHALGELRAVAHVIVFTEIADLSRASLLGWLSLWGVPHDDAANLTVERPRADAVIDWRAVEVPRNPWFREWDAALAGVAGRLGVPPGR